MAHTSIRPNDILRTVTDHPLRLVAPVIGLTLLAAVYAIVRPATWDASQALVVRDEAGDRLTRPGKFAHLDEMKASQETVLELARSRGVLLKALAEVGPPANRDSATAWPSEKDIEALQGSVKIAPPKGAEFGKTEVFYLNVQADSPQRAVALATAICGQLQARFAQLREAKAGSTTDELTQSVRLAKEELAISTAALRTMEQTVGGDLAELRILNEAPAGDSDLRRNSLELEKELRTYRASAAENEEFLKLLTLAQDDPSKLLASPSVLLKSQPALGRLKDGLVDAQLRTGQALGSMAEDHPLVKSARSAEEAIRQQLHDEIKTAIRGVNVDLRVQSDRIRSLEEQHQSVQGRFGTLAALRAEYANLVTATKQRSETLRAVEHDLAEARASQAAARSASLINLVDSPTPGTRPVGPGRSMIVLAGFAGGLLVGFSMVFLTVRPQENPVEAAAANVVPVIVPVPVAPAAVVTARSRSFASEVRRPSAPLNLKQALQKAAGHQI